jgi:hypothetical protein
MPTHHTEHSDPFDSPPQHTSWAYGPEISDSPWSASSQTTGNNMSLTLPSITPGDLAEQPDLYETLQSSSFLPRSEPLPRTRPFSNFPSLIRQPTHRRQIFLPDSPEESSDPFESFEPSRSFAHSPTTARAASTNTRASSIVDLTTEPSSVEMPAKRKRGPSPSSQERAVKRSCNIDLSKTPEPEVAEDGSKIESLDLSHIDSDAKYEEERKKQQAELLAQQQKEDREKPIKLSQFQCIICMDSPTNLTVTYCGKSHHRQVTMDILTWLIGHLFCGPCLHEALYAGSGPKKNCPVCRSDISTRNGDPKRGDGKGRSRGRPSIRGGASNSKGWFPLNMKLMTANRKGKQPERA